MKRSHEIPRRTLLKALPLVGACGLPAVHVLGATRPSKQRSIRYAGWQVGITYQAPGPQGMTRDELMRLLDEMAGRRMNLLSLMMLSYGYFDLNHDGYCWPVNSDKLKHYWDGNSVNGRPKTEFVGEAIRAAADRGIEVQLFMNWGFWNPEKIRAGYPTATSQLTRKDAIHGKPIKRWLHCPDSPGGWQAGLDEVADLLTFYNHPNVKSYSLERLSYGNTRVCYCPYSQERFHQDTGGSLLEADAKAIEAWKQKRIMPALKQYVEHVHKIKPGTGVWLHTQCARGWGHDPAGMRAAGIDYLVPHTIQFRETKQKTHRKLRRLAPNPCVLHFCTRDRRPANYNLWLKTPEIIAEALGWVRSYPGENLAGLLFFNPNATSARNRQAVYEQLKHFDWPRA